MIQVYNGKIWYLIGWLVVLRIYIVLAVFQTYRDVGAEDYQFLNL